jgi:hypothetical protein
MEGLVAMFSASEQPVVHAVTLGFSALVGAATWFVRNKATFDQIADSIDNDAAVAEQVGKKVATDPVVVDQVVKKNADLVEELIKKYRTTH